MVTGIAVFAFLPFGFLLQQLPLSVLAAVVIVAVIPLMSVRRVIQVARISTIQLSISLTAFFLTLLLAPHVEWAILAAIALSVTIHLWRELRLDVTATVNGDSVELSPEGVLWFGNARRLEDRFSELLAEYPEAVEVVVRLNGLGRVDLSGALVLHSLLEDARRVGLKTSIRGIPPHAERILSRVLATMWSPVSR